MHHTKPRPFGAIWTLLLGLTLGGPCLAQAPADAKPARVSTLNLPVNATQRLQMAKKQKIAKLDNPKPEIARVVADPTDPTSVLVTGVTAGTVRLTLVGEDSAVEEIITNVQAFDVEYLRGMYRQVIPTANIVPIPSANNTLILTGTVARAEDVDLALQVTRSVVGQNVLTALRVGGVNQVQLEVVIAQVARSENRRMAFEFMNFGGKHVLASGLGGLTIPSAGVAGTFPGAPSITNTLGTVNGAPFNAFFGIFDPRQDFFGFLQVLRDENLAKLQTFPKVVVMSGRTVSFLSGGEQAVPVPGGLGQVGVQFEEFGTRLNALPIVMGNGKIHLDLEPEVSSLNAAFGTSVSGTVVPGRTSQRVRTTVELESGQTLCIGGLIQNQVTATSRKVPILGDLPFIGAAFSQKNHVEDENELVILVTPRLIDALSCDQVPRLPGQETRSPDDFELFLEGILEAPRGQREVFPNRHYRAAFLNSPTASTFPCGDNNCGHVGHGHKSHGGHGLWGSGRSSTSGACVTPTAGTSVPHAGAHQAGQPLPSGLMETRQAVQPLVLPLASGEAKPEITPPASLGNGPAPVAGETPVTPLVTPPEASGREQPR